MIPSLSPALPLALLLYYSFFFFFFITTTLVTEKFDSHNHKGSTSSCIGFSPLFQSYPRMLPWNSEAYGWIDASCTTAKRRSRLVMFLSVSACYYICFLSFLAKFNLARAVFNFSFYYSVLLWILIFTPVLYYYNTLSL